MRIIFMGTPMFALPSLEKIYKEHEVIAVFTKADKPNARGKKIKYSPIKEFALANNLRIYQPETFKDEALIEEIKNMQPDLIVVVAYGKILPKEVLDIPKYGIINVHSSLLPKYRGAAPIHAAIINGDDKTGVSIMYISEGLDEGDVILTKETPIYLEDNLGTLHDRLKVLGAEGVKETIKLMKENKVIRHPQDSSLVTFVKPIKKEETKIDFNDKSINIFNKIRGMNPFPVAYTTLNDKILKLYDSMYVEYAGNEIPGTVLSLDKYGIKVKTSDGAILIKELKLEGKKKQKATDFINGRQINLNDILK